MRHINKGTRIAHARIRSLAPLIDMLHASHLVNKAINNSKAGLLVVKNKKTTPVNKLAQKAIKKVHAPNLMNKTHQYKGFFNTNVLYFNLTARYLSLYPPASTIILTPKKTL